MPSQASRNTVHDAAATLDGLADKVQNGAPLNDGERCAIRAALNHAACEMRASYGLQQDGEAARAHDPDDWLQLAIYVNDPF